VLAHAKGSLFLVIINPRLRGADDISAPAAASFRQILKSRVVVGKTFAFCPQVVFTGVQVATPAINIISKNVKLVLKRSHPIMVASFWLFAKDK